MYSSTVWACAMAPGPHTMVSAQAAASGPARAAGTDDRPTVLRGATASAPVAAGSLDVDLRDLPVLKDWEPGDAIKEVPH